MKWESVSVSPAVSVCTLLSVCVSVSCSVHCSQCMYTAVSVCLCFLQCTLQSVYVHCCQCVSLFPAVYTAVSVCLCFLQSVYACHLLRKQKLLKVFQSLGVYKPDVRLPAEVSLIDTDHFTCHCLSPPPLHIIIVTGVPYWGEDHWPILHPAHCSPGTPSQSACVQTMPTHTTH